MPKSSVIVPTPLGDLVFAVTDGRDAPVDSDYSLVAVPVLPELPPGMSVDGAVAVLLAVRPQAELAGVTFSCSWREPPPSPGGPSTGQWLDAQSWDDGDHEVLVGTEDSEMLLTRLPECGFREQPYPVEYLPDGLRLIIPRMTAGTASTFHFIVACNRLPDPAECSAWFAVDMPHRQVMALAEAAGAFESTTPRSPG